LELDSEADVEIALSSCWFVIKKLLMSISASLGGHQTQRFQQRENTTCDTLEKMAGSPFINNLFMIPHEFATATPQQRQQSQQQRRSVTPEKT
jgi:hypothetical protein